MSKHFVSLEVIVEVEISDPDVVDRVDDEWRAHLYDLNGLEDILDHLAWNAVHNQIEDVRELDGWADLPKGAATMRVQR